MSELIQQNDNRATIRWKLLTGASALALIASSPVMAGNDGGHPLLWIELGGNANMISGIDSRFTAPFITQMPVPTPYLADSPLDLQKPSRFTFGGEAKLTFQPEDSDWIFAAGIRYGRSNNKRDVHHQTSTQHKFNNPKYELIKAFYPSTPTKFTAYPVFKYKTADKFAETTINQSEHHLVVDFQAGKDVGLGMFGSNASSIISAGVRLARFNSHSDVKIRAKPDVNFYTVPFFGGLVQYPASSWNTYYLRGDATRSFHGIGPSLAWSGSAPIAGNVQDGQLAVDWGLNGALLFGKQTARTSHSTTGTRFQAYYGGYHSLYHTANHSTRSRSVTVPNFGANIGISYRIEDAKLSLGYRTDYFFGAIDEGIDTAKKTTLGFNGLYASISIGLGD